MASGLPAIPSGLPADLRQFLSRIREFVTSGQFVSPADLVSAGIASVDAYGKLVGTAPGSNESGPLDMTPPPAPVNVRANGAMTNIILEWDNPHYSNLSYAEIYRSGTALFSDAVHVGVSSGTLYADAVAEGSSYWYWVRFWSKADVVGPWNATAGTPGSTTPNPGYLMDLLTGADPLIPFITLAVPTEINGETVPAGVYMKNGFMDTLVAKRGQIGALAVDDAAIANVSADKVTFGEMSGDRIALHSLKGDRADIDTFVTRLATITYAYVYNANISGAIYSNDYVAGVSGWKIDKGGSAEFNSGTFRGDVDVSGTVRSYNYVAGASGWKIDKSGAAEFNTGTFRGAVNVGAYTGYAWPAAGQYGAHLSASGLLLGNENNGKYFKVTADGNLYSPGISIVNGVLTITDPSNGKIILTSGSYSIAEAAARANWNGIADTGGKPANYADVTSQNTAAGIANQGTFATVGRISTYIADAYMDSLSVNGSKITGTISGSVYLPMAGVSPPIYTVPGRYPLVSVSGGTFIVSIGYGYFIITNRSTETVDHGGEVGVITTAAAATATYVYL